MIPQEQTDFKEDYNAAEESITFKISLLKNVLVQGETESTLSLTEEEN